MGPASPNTPMPVPIGFSPEQAATLHLQMQAIQQVLPTPEKKWYDRVVDSILGEDPCKRSEDVAGDNKLTPASPAHAGQSKYALVCGECFRHNGLVGSKYEWERMRGSSQNSKRS